MHAPTELRTLDELAGVVAAALSPARAGAPTDARVRAVPDQRTVRYYTTIGLVDRPVSYRGRTALYGERHLLQLLAIKALQADGRSLVEVQHALAGLPDAELASIAGRARPAPAQAPVLVPPPRPAGVRDAAPRAAAAAARHTAGGVAGRPDFWRAASAEAASVPVALHHDPAQIAATRVDRGGPRHVTPLQERLLAGVELGDGLTVLFPNARPLRPDDRDALAAAAHPLREALRARGLTKGTA